MVWVRCQYGYREVEAALQCARVAADAAEEIGHHLRGERRSRGLRRRCRAGCRSIGSRCRAAASPEERGECAAAGARRLEKPARLAGGQALKGSVLSGREERSLELLSGELSPLRFIFLAHRNQTETDAAHLVGRFLAPPDAFRRVARIARVACRVVVGDAHVDARALWQHDRLLVVVAILPVEVPILD